MNRRVGVSLLLCLTLFGCGGTSISVVAPDADGKTHVYSGPGGELPPVEAVVSERGIAPAPTATPGQPTPVHPIETPAPAATPAPYSTPRAPGA